MTTQSCYWTAFKHCLRISVGGFNLQNNSHYTESLTVYVSETHLQAHTFSCILLTVYMFHTTGASTKTNIQQQVYLKMMNLINPTNQ